MSFKQCLVVVCILINCSISFAQRVGTETRQLRKSLVPPSPQQIADNPCSKAANYIPFEPEYYPTKTLRVAFHIFQKDDGSGNFQDTPADRAILQSFMDEVNRRYASLDPHDPPVNSPHITDSRIHFSLERIFFHRDSLAWNMDDNGPCGPYNSCGQKLYRQYVLNNHQLSVYERENMLHIFMGESPGYPYATGGAASGIGSKKYIRSRGYYWYYYKHPHLDWARDYVKGNIAHELGHSLGLTHTFEGGGCTLANDPPRPPRKGTPPTNNILDYGSWRALTACQLGVIHHNIYQNRGNLHDIWVKDFLVLQPQETITIKAGEEVVWNSPRYLKGNLMIERGAKLTIQCNIGMPPGSEVQVNRGGWLLIANGGMLSGSENSRWKGVTPVGEKAWLKFYRRDGSPINFGRVEVIDGGKIICR
jgi:hypothetical protein